MNIRIKQLLLNVAKATLDYKVSWYKQDSGYTVGLSDGRSINLVLYKDEYLDEPWKITFRFFLEGSSRSFDYFFFEEPFMQLFLLYRAAEQNAWASKETNFSQL